MGMANSRQTLQERVAKLTNRPSRENVHFELSHFLVDGLDADMALARFGRRGSEVASRIEGLANLLLDNACTNA